jgi:hypothetical protein
LAQRLQWQCVVFTKREKKLDHTVIYRLKTRAKSLDQKRVEALLAASLARSASHLTPIHIINQLHEKKIRFTIRTCPP